VTKIIRPRRLDLWPSYDDQVWNATTSATTGNYRLTWEQWCTSSSSVTGTSNHLVASYWAQWNNEVIKQERALYNKVYHSPEAQAQRQRDAEAARRVQLAAEAERKAAMEKAEQLLQSALDPVQREELKARGHFHCRSRTGQIYRIYRGSHGNVRLVRGDREVEKLCVQPEGVPVPDMMLAQKLHIEHCEEDFRRTANITRLN
jgi:hypothetical protein